MSALMRNCRLSREPTRAAELTQALEQEVEKCPEAQRLQTHPRVGALRRVAAALSPSNTLHNRMPDKIFWLDSGLCSRVYAFFMSGMQIGELAKRTTLTIDAIRFYEKRRLLPKAARSAGGFRLYTTSDIEQLHFIRQMHALGFSLREIRELIELRTRKVAACESVRELVKDKLAGVRAKLHKLQKLEAELMADLRKCNKELKRRQRHSASACPVLEEVVTK